MNTQSTSTRRRTAALAGLALAASAGAVSLSSPAAADPGNGTQHLVAQQTDYFPRPGDDASTFYDIFSLDGVCGFASALYSVSDTETFFVAQHQTQATGYKYNSVGKIDNEQWSLTPVAADGTTLPTFSGTADEVATAVGIDAGATPLSVNYSFHGTATNPAGQRLDLVVKGVVRTDADHNITRFDWGVQSCNVH